MKKILVIGKTAEGSSISIMVSNFEKLLPPSEYSFNYIISNNHDEVFDSSLFINSDVVLIVRYISISENKFNNIINKYPNKLFILIIDDNFLKLHELKEFTQYKILMPEKPLYKNIENLLTKSNIIISTNDNITSYVSKYNKNITKIHTNILPNYIDEQRGSFHDPIKIAYLGSRSREKEFKLIGEDLKKISSKYENKIEFFFYNFIPKFIKEITKSKVTSCGAYYNYYNYLDTIKKEQFDILLSPLLDEGPKIYKSNVKIIDACVCNAIGIFSDSVVYEDIIHMQNGVKVKNNCESWFDGIDLAINLSIEKRNEILSNAKKMVLEKYNTEKYLNIFESVLNHNLKHVRIIKNNSNSIIVNDLLSTESIFQSNKRSLNPDISVILPTYCRGNSGFLIRSINSVLSQTFKNFELIIVDDGSIDNTQEIVKGFMNIDNRIVYVRNEINSGLPAIRVNQGASYARGRYIAYQFDDDIWNVDALENLFKGILINFDFVYGKANLVSLKNKSSTPLGVNFDYSMLLRNNIIPNNAVLHKKELFNKYGGFDCDISLRRACDWDLWLRSTKEIKVLFIDKLISTVFLHDKDSLGMTGPTCNIPIKNANKINRIDELSLENFHNYKILHDEYLNGAAETNKVYSKAMYEKIKNNISK